nr:DNA mismatch repair protein MutL-like [Nerophis lumbriciformis]
MPDTLASQVAAGEVIERPASVIKELIENSVDAGARKIEVDIQRGGAAMMRVRDDGCGMSEKDARMSLERHATSKLKTADDLNSILTLGFRGEALPSIASVSRFTLTTCGVEAMEGTEIRVNGGEVESVKAMGCPAGTCIEVRDLFYNVPARKKFLRAESTESAHIDHQVRLHALSTPEIGWVLRRDGRVVFDLPATTDRRVRIAAMAGEEAARELIVVKPCEMRGVTISGAVLPASYARGGRKHQYIFLNGRPVEDATISNALRDAFRGALAEKLQPAAWLWIEMDPAEVDVNVHPAKREVRFREPSRLRVVILEAMERALRAPSEIVIEPEDRPVFQSEQSEGNHASSVESDKSVEAVETVENLPTSQVQAEVQPIWRSSHQKELEMTEEQTEKPNFRIVGKLSDRYALLEGEEGLVLLEPKAARERVTYERLLKQEGDVASQGLLVPVLIELDARDVDLLMRYADHFREAGFALEDFGGRTVQISAVPAFLNLDEARPFLIKLVDTLLDREGLGRVQRLAYEGFSASVAKVSLLQAHWELSGLDDLLAELFACDLPYCNPAGKPTLIQISYQELDRKFGK